MAAIDYNAIANEIRAVLKSYSTKLADCSITVESEQPLDSKPWIAIYLDSREPDTRDGQPLAAGQKTRYLIRFNIWCHAFGADNVGATCEMRDDLLHEVELALMNERTLNEKVSMSYLDGGRFQSGSLVNAEGKVVPGNVASGEIIFVVQATASL